MRYLPAIAVIVVALFSVDAGSTVTDSAVRMTGVRQFRHIYPRKPLGIAGNVEVVRWRLNDRFGRPIGIASFDWRWVTARQRLGYGEFRLPNGTIVVAGSSRTRVIVYLAVVGGTGVYERRTGVARMRLIGESHSAIQIELHP